MATNAPDLTQLWDSLINRQTLAELGQTSLFIIKKRTQRGEFLPGSSTGAGSYSTRPFAMPAGALAKGVFQKLDDTGEGTTLFTRNGALWAVIKGGYKRYRELAGRQSGKVDLKFRSGPGMMNSLNVTKIDTRRKNVEIGFTDSESEQIAKYHQILGAGKRKVKRRFVGHTRKERREITRNVQQNIFANLTRFNN